MKPIKIAVVAIALSLALLATPNAFASHFHVMHYMHNGTHHMHNGMHRAHMRMHHGRMHKRMHMHKHNMIHHGHM